MSGNPSPDLNECGVVSATSTVALSGRPSRPPNYAAENRAMAMLAQTMAASPDRMLQELSDTALALCHAHSAGLSLLEDEDHLQAFHWRAISGEWAPHVNGGTPRDFGPCGTILDRNMPLLFSHPERDFPYFGEVSPLIEEALLLPFYVEGHARGTIWVVFHDASRRFDAEDLRVLTNLGNFAGLAYQTRLSLRAARRAELERAETAAALERFTAIIESSDDAILSKNLNGVITSWNSGAERLFGYTAQEAVGKSVVILIPPDRLNEEPEILSRIRRGERIDHYETKRARKDGSIVDISLTVSPVKDAAGRVIGASKIARNISDQKRLQEKQSLIVEEMKHRVKNTLTIVQAVAIQTLRETPSEERNAFVARLQSLAHAHDILTRENWQRASLLELINRTLEPFRADCGDRFSVAGPAVWLDANKSTLLGMVIHELATNAFKYGALSTSAGQVSITWTLQPDDPRAAFFQWKESGGPTVVPPERRGFGSRLIERVLKPQFGEPDLQYLPQGVICRLAIPA